MPRRHPAGVAAALAVGLVLAACGTGDSPEAAVRASAGSIAETSTTTATAPPVTSTTTAAATTTTQRATTTSSTRPAATPTTAATATALAPAAPGTYRYDTVGTTTFAGSPVLFPAVTTLVVDPPSKTVQHSTRNLRDPAGNGPATELTLDYRAQGVYLVALKVTVGISGLSDSQEFRPPAPVLLLATGARPGAHTEAELGGAAAGAKLVVDVLREERVTVAGQAVDTLVMRAAVTLPPGDVTGHQELTVNVDRGSRLWVKERSVLDASAAGGLFTLHSEYTANLQRLTP